MASRQQHSTTPSLTLWITCTDTQRVRKANSTVVSGFVSVSSALCPRPPLAVCHVFTLFVFEDAFHDLLRHVRSATHISSTHISKIYSTEWKCQSLKRNVGKE